MKNVLISILKFTLLFVPAYLMISWYVPERRAQMLSAGLLAAAGKSLIMGILIGTFFLVGIWLIDRFKK